MFTEQAFGNGKWMCSGEENLNKLEVTAGQVESCVSSVVCDVGCVGDLQELDPYHGANYTHFAQEAEELREGKVQAGAAADAGPIMP